MDELEQYLKTHPNFRLVRDDYKIRYTYGVKNETMSLYFVVNEVINEHWVNGMWRVSRFDGQLCQYFDTSFTKALRIFERGKESHGKN